MRTFTRRQIETTLAALLAAVTAIIGISARDNEPPLGPKFVTLDKVGRFEEPVHMAQPPGVELPLFVVERRGRVRTIAGGHVRAAPFLDIRDAVRHSGKGGEQGLMSIAFPPDYAASGYFYVAYTDRRDALRVVEFRRSAADPLRARRKSARLVLRIPQPTTKHHGGLLAFGPDKYLYIGVGDGGPSGDPNDVAQSKRVLLGKLLRIDPRLGPARPRKRGRPRRAPYTVPADNPFVGRLGRDEIFAYGLRNPWRFSFDRSPTAGDLLTLADVGNERYEEINILPLRKARGANFGWSHFEGPMRFKPGLKRRRTVVPTRWYPIGGPRCSVVGGYVVRDPRLSRIKGREIIGSYLYGDFCSKRLFRFRLRPRRVGPERSFRFQVPGVTSFARDRAGRIYVLSYEGPIYRLDPRRKRVSP